MAEIGPSPHYFSLSLTLSRPARAQAVSLSGPGAPATERAPIIWLPTLIGKPPTAVVVPGDSGGRTGSLGGAPGRGPEGLPSTITVVAFCRPTSTVAIGEP